MVVFYVGRKMETVLSIKASTHTYDVVFCSLSELKDAAGFGGVKAALVDKNVFDLYIKKHGFSEISNILTLNATEDEKTVEHGGLSFLTHLQTHETKRTDTVLCMGGGIMQDIGTFSVLTYLRGVPWVLVPTTLLSMCDSCIGSKFGLNLNGRKNQVGGYHAPSKVVICTDFLETLKDDDIRSGYGEILKLSLTGDEPFYDELKEKTKSGNFRGLHLNRFIILSLKAKKAIIEVDEFEKNSRLHLNYGHTFGHALESLTNFDVPHGLGVVFGINLVNYIAMREGVLSESLYRDILDYSSNAFPLSLQKGRITADALIECVKNDKKSLKSAIRLVLLEKPGTFLLKDFAFDDTLKGYVSDFLRQNNL